MAKTSSSEVFETWADKVRMILNELPKTAIDGQPLEFQDDEYQKVMNKLQQCSFNFFDFPVYPINEVIANKLIQDQLKGYDEQSDN